jgi:hypothetical protein
VEVSLRIGMASPEGGHGHSCTVVLLHAPGDSAVAIDHAVLPDRLADIEALQAAMRGSWAIPIIEAMCFPSTAPASPDEQQCYDTAVSVVEDEQSMGSVRVRRFREAATTYPLCRQA